MEVEEEEDVGCEEAEEGQGNDEGEGLAWLLSLQGESPIPRSSLSEC